MSCSKDATIKLYPTIHSLFIAQKFCDFVNPLSAEFNFRYLSYSAYLILSLAFFLVSIDYNRCFELRESPTSNQLAAFFYYSALEKITCTYTKVYISKNKK